MGYKEIILIVFCIIMVILAVLYGVSMFQMHFQAAQRDALISELSYIHLRTYAHWISTISQSGDSYAENLQAQKRDITGNYHLGDWLSFNDLTFSPFPGTFFSTTNGVYTITTEHQISERKGTTESFIVFYASGQGEGKDKQYLNNRSWGNSLFTFPDGSERRGRKGLSCYKTRFSLESGEITIEILN